VKIAVLSSLTCVAAGVLATALTAVAAPTATFGDGTHRVVGRDIPAGTYRAPKANDGCYWARLRNFTGSLGGIIANGNTSGPEIVRIRRTDRGFQSARCGTRTSNLARITKSRTRFGEGTYIVRTDVLPGTYRSTRGRAATGLGCGRSRASSAQSSPTATRPGARSSPSRAPTAGSLPRDAGPGRAFDPSPLRRLDSTFA
jgi:hypothetical protein